MKRHFMKLTVVLCAVLCAGASFANGRMIAVGAKNIFVPKGFDANDRVELMLEVELPHTCVLRPQGQVTVRNQAIEIALSATDVRDENTVCIQAIHSTMVTVPVGQVDVGEYDIFVNAGTDTANRSKITVIEPPSKSIDNYPYASVTNVFAVNGADVVEIRGAHPSSCVEIDRVDIYPNEMNDTFAILPIVKQTSEICDTMMTPFTHHVELPKTDKKSVAVHVRRMDGTALNYMIKKD